MKCKRELVLCGLAGRAEWCVLMWFGHMEGREDDWLVKMG